MMSQPVACGQQPLHCTQSPVLDAVRQPRVFWVSGKAVGGGKGMVGSGTGKGKGKGSAARPCFPSHCCSKAASVFYWRTL
jgi:hypothetical protein